MGAAKRAFVWDFASRKVPWAVMDEVCQVWGLEPLRNVIVPVLAEERRLWRLGSEVIMVRLIRDECGTRGDVFFFHSESAQDGESQCWEHDSSVTCHRALRPSTAAAVTDEVDTEPLLRAIRRGLAPQLVREEGRVLVIVERASGPSYELAGADPGGPDPASTHARSLWEKLHGPLGLK